MGGVLRPVRFPANLEAGICTSRLQPAVCSPSRQPIQDESDGDWTGSGAKACEGFVHTQREYQSEHTDPTEGASGVQTEPGNCPSLANLVFVARAMCPTEDSNFSICSKGR